MKGVRPLTGVVPPPSPPVFPSFRTAAVYNGKAHAVASASFIVTVVNV